MDQLYIVDYPINTEYAEAAIIQVNRDYDRIERCPQCGAYVSGAYWLPPREVVLTKHKAPDFLYTYCDNAPFVISERALEAIRQAGLTGITRAEEIELIRFQRKPKHKKPLPRYFRIETARSRMTIDHEHSVIRYGKHREGPVCSLCRPVPATYNFFGHLQFRTEEYEGWDVFRTYEMGNTLFLSRLFLEVVKEHNLTNLHCKPAQKHGPQISTYFPEDGNI